MRKHSFPRANASSISARIFGSLISSNIGNITASITLPNCFRRHASSCQNSPAQRGKRKPSWWRSLKAYGLLKHRHLAEVEEQIKLHTGEPTIVQFNPHLAPLRRGIATTITAPASAGATIEQLYSAWRAVYGSSPFVQVLPSGETPDTAYTVNTNRIDISAVLDPRTKNFVITAAEDNLMKGASGQAVQIMNLWCGFPETAGLH